jgi:uncharacterized membrane protein YphA (DoxX/SURF4 family)
MLQIIQAFWRRISSGPRERQAMALLRILTGLFFLLEGHHRLTHIQLEAQWLSQLKAWAASNPFPLYKAWMLQGMLPNAPQVANWVTDLEILVGVSYVTGFLVPLGAGLAILLTVNWGLAAQHTSPETLGLSLLLTLISLVLFWGKAGQQFGLDQFFLLSTPKGKRHNAMATRTQGWAKNRKPMNGKTPFGLGPKPENVKAKSSRLRRKTESPATSERENVRKFERPAKREQPVKPTSAKASKLEQLLKQETDKQKQQPEPKPPVTPEKKPPAQSPEPEAMPENLKVIKIFDHRTPDDDD